jgi:hypothetical protein
MGDEDKPSGADKAPQPEPLPKPDPALTLQVQNAEKPGKEGPNTIKLVEKRDGKS